MGKHDESDENETPGEKARAKRAEDDRRRSVVPEPSSGVIFRWLEKLFWAADDALDEGRSGWPQKIVLTVALGTTGTRLGPCVMEVPFAHKKDKEKPTRERLVELSNEFLAASQNDCDGLNRPTRYALSAYDSRRSDRSYSRLLIKLAPSGVSTALEMERGVGVLDDEEGNALSTKLVVGLLLEERRDRRWSQEMMANVLSGAAERDNERMERMEHMLDGAWQKQQAMMQATEVMLSQANERRITQEWAAFKKIQIENAIEWGKTMLPALLPALLPGGGGGQAGEAPNPLTKLLGSLSDEEAKELFGEVIGEGADRRVTGGVFTDEQFQIMKKLIIAKTPEPADVTALASSMSMDQIERCKMMIGLVRLAPLYAWLSSQQANANGAAH